MGFRVRLIGIGIAALCGCGDVKGSPDAGDDGGGIDGPTIDACVGCLSNGDSCSIGSECSSGECACSNPTCSTRVCSPTACACQYTATGSTCDGYVAAGYDDSVDSCGTSTCDGTGACGEPLLWFRFDEAAGTGTVANSGTWPGSVASVAGAQGVPGKIGSAIALAAPSDGVVIDDALDGSLDGFTTWTAEAWINMTALPVDGYATLVKKDGAYICRLVEVAGCASCYTDQGIAYAPSQQAANWSLPTPPSTGTWYHVACRYEANTVTVFWNGVAQASLGGGNGALVDSTSGIGIGKSADAAAIETLAGSLDDFKMWSTPRSDRQICLDACGSYAGTTCTFDGICD